MRWGSRLLVCPTWCRGSSEMAMIYPCINCLSFGGRVSHQIIPWEASEMHNVFWLKFFFLSNHRPKEKILKLNVTSVGAGHSQLLASLWLDWFSQGPRKIRFFASNQLLKIDQPWVYLGLLKCVEIDVNLLTAYDDSADTRHVPRSAHICATQRKSMQVILLSSMRH